MPLQIQIKTERSTFYDMQVRAIIGGLNAPFSGSDTAYEAMGCFNRLIKHVPKHTTATADMCYRAELSENGLQVTIHHLNLMGEPDRVVAVLTTIK